MQCFSKSHLDYEPSPIALKNLEIIRLISGEQKKEAKKLLKQFHYLKDNSGKGRKAYQAITYKGQWLAIIEWASPALYLKDRDEWIGWNRHMITQRRELIINNTRFLILSKERMPNLASKALALACKDIPSFWNCLYDYEPLLAETFTDIEQFEGTCYKAAGWQERGLTQGYSKHGKEFQQHDRPKKLWIKTLSKNARRVIIQTKLPEKHQAGVNLQSPERILALRAAQQQSLMDVLRKVPDPRRYNSRFTKVSLLTLVMLGLLAGNKNLAEIQRYASLLTIKQRKRIGFPAGKTNNYKPPSYNCIKNLLQKIDPHLFSDCINQWFEQNEGILDAQLALDGKYISDKVLTVALSTHETGSPQAVKIAPPAEQTEENKQAGENTVSKEMFSEMDLSGKTITADALSGNQPMARQSPPMVVITSSKSKATTPMLTTMLSKCIKKLPPFLPQNLHR